MSDRPTTAQLPAVWRAEADRLERFTAPAATAFRDAALQLEQSLRDAAGEVLSLQEAALRSGLSIDRLRHLIAEGSIQNAGRKGKPLVRAADLPIPRRKQPAVSAEYDVDADARRLARGAR